MNKLPSFIFLLLLFFSFSTKAQQKEKRWQLIDTSVLKIPKPLLTQTGNYNHFNIYQSTPDNMFVIKPDSSIIFTMPNASKQIIIQNPVLKPKEK